MTTSSTVKLNLHLPPKPKGWCKEQGIDHAWSENGLFPNVFTRSCLNCGQQQILKPAEWEDV